MVYIACGKQEMCVYLLVECVHMPEIESLPGPEKARILRCDNDHGRPRDAQIMLVGRYLRGGRETDLVGKPSLGNRQISN